MSSAPPIQELSSTTIHCTPKQSYRLRVIQYLDKQGVVQRKFGISEFWLHTSGRWFPSCKHHVFLPLAVWPKLINQTRTIEWYTEDTNINGGQHSRAGAASEQSAGEHESGTAITGQRRRYSDYSDERSATAIASASTGEGHGEGNGATETKKCRKEGDYPAGNNADMPIRACGSNNEPRPPW